MDTSFCRTNECGLHPALSDAARADIKSHQVSENVATAGQDQGAYTCGEKRFAQLAHLNSSTLTSSLIHLSLITA
ncbi:MAG TPA: hypothetical protein PKD54_00220, partial [Pirellulaceae bacterium]|nr:hypothetical protein [Pirellulaceae bacterium]